MELGNAFNCIVSVSLIDGADNNILKTYSRSFSSLALSYVGMVLYVEK